MRTNKSFVNSFTMKILVSFITKSWRDFRRFCPDDCITICIKNSRFKLKVVFSELHSGFHNSKLGFYNSELGFLQLETRFSLLETHFLQLETRFYNSKLAFYNSKLAFTTRFCWLESRFSQLETRNLPKIKLIHYAFVKENPEIFFLMSLTK